MPDARPPRGTGAVGRALWTSISEQFDLESHEVQMVTVADRVEELDRAVARDGVLLEGRVHPALVESRLQRVTLARLLAGLRLPDKEEHRPQRRGSYRRSYKLRSVMGDGA